MSFEKVIALIDMDCFYVQCEQRLAPEFWCHPCAVAQYNSWKGGGLIAVNYEARNHGVKRGIRGNDAMALCPDIHIFSVPEVRGKADLTRYREASHEVFEAIKHFVSTLNPNIIVEKASIDEAFIDLTEHINQLVDSLEPVPEVDVFEGTKIEVDSENDLNQWLNQLRDNQLMFANDIRLALGAVVVQQIRKEILDKTQFKCSAGISHNKMLSKLVCAVNKPNAQTILPQKGIEQLFRRTDLKKVRSLGGKLGAQIKLVFKINTMYELKCLEYKELAKVFDPKTAKWLKEVADGLDDDPVTNRQISKSLGCGKNFPGKTALATLEDVRYWVKQLSEELVERMARDKEINKRSPKLMVIGFKFNEKDHNSRSLPLDSNASANQIADQIMKQLFNRMKLEPIVNLSIAASKFLEESDDPSHNTIKLDNYFKKVDKNNVFPGEDDRNGSALKKIKNIHTNTLEDLWKASTSTAPTNDSIETDIQILDMNCEHISKNTPNQKPTKNPYNLKVNEIYSINRVNNTMNNESNKRLDTNSENMSSDLPIVIDISDNQNFTLNSNESTARKPEKRGFFFRKLMELRAEERGAEQERIRQRIAIKNANDDAHANSTCTSNKQSSLDRFLRPKSSLT